MREGKGKYLWLDGAVYEGEYKQGEQDGEGRFIRPDGVEMGGEFRADNRDGICYNITKQGGVFGLYKEDNWNGMVFNHIKE